MVFILELIRLWQWFSHQSEHQKSPAENLRCQFSDPPPRDSDSVGVHWGLDVFFKNPTGDSPL